MKIAVAGLGLIGGSFALALKKRTSHTVLGLDADPETVRAADPSAMVHPGMAPLLIMHGNQDPLVPWESSQSFYEQVNRVCGEERMIVADQAGTTRDASDTPVENQWGRYVFIDTAGIRRKSRVEEEIER